MSKFLFDLVEPYSVGALKVSDVHTIYYELSGNKNGIPVVALHGGPGGGSSPGMRQFFDPSAYNIILFDQRGCGQSIPFACLQDNTTWDLVEDIEKIRKMLGIEKWIVFGGSWGAGLALAYAQTYVERVQALILRGIFTLREKELKFFYQEGASMLFPDYWEPYKNHIPEEERGDYMAAYHKRLTSDIPEIKYKAAIVWTDWEMNTSRLIPDPTYGRERTVNYEEFSLAFARIENHYFYNKGFMKEGQLISNAHLLKDIPTTIIQGRYDVVCPAYTAYDLYQALGGKSNPKVDFVFTITGHSAKEDEIAENLVKASNKYKEMFAKKT